MQNNWRFLGTLGRVLKLLSGVSNLNRLLVIIHLNIITNLALGMLVVNDNPECDAEVRPRPWLDLQTSHWWRGRPTHRRLTHCTRPRDWQKAGKSVELVSFFIRNWSVSRRFQWESFWTAPTLWEVTMDLNWNLKRGSLLFIFSCTSTFSYEIWDLTLFSVYIWKSDLVLHAAPINRHLQSIGEKTAGSSHLGLL